MNKRIHEIEARKAEIRKLIEQPDADLDALEAELRALNAELEELRSREESRAALRNLVAGGAGTVVDSGTPETRTRSNDEIRNSPEYIEAFARYLRTGDSRECRALLTENVNGDVAVPDIVDQTVRTAWEKDQILSRVKKTAFRGNYRVQFENSATGAVVHTEGTEAPSEEELRLGIVTMIPATIKKWVTISDEVVAMGGEGLIQYVYNEVTYQIVRKLAALVIADIVGAGTSHSATAIGIPTVAADPSLIAIATAIANLSDEAVNPVVIINPLTYINFKAAGVAGNYAIDPFEGLTVVKTNALPAFDTASSGDVYAIVGDLSGAQVNYPEGEGVTIKFDDLTNAEADMVKIIGRQYAAHAVTGPGRFARLAKE